VTKKIKKVAFSCYADGALGPDGVSFMFYQRFWEIVNKDLLDMFNDFYLLRWTRHV
jgi:hypothetical protein